MHDGFENFFGADSFFGAGKDGVFRVQADDVFDLVLDARDFRARQIDFVDDGNDFEMMVQGQVGVGERLRFNSLRGIDHQKRSFAGGKASGNLVGKIDVSRRVDQVQDIILSVFGPVVQPHGMRFDGDAPFPFQIHRVQDLVGHFALCQCSGPFQKAVGQGRFAVVDMRDDGKIANMALIVQHYSSSIHSRIEPLNIPRRFQDSKTHR